MAKRLTQDVFIKKAAEKHQHKFDYSLVKYVNYDTIIVVVCPIHGPFNTIPRTHLLSNHTCKKCGLLYRVQNTLEKYGVEHTTQLTSVQEKRKQTSLKKYGVEYPTQSKQVQDRTKQTNLYRYGCEFTTQVLDFQAKKENTFIDRYGTKYPQQNIDVSNKRKSTMVERYGVEYPQQNTHIRDKTSHTNLERYGTICSISNRQDEFIAQRFQTNLERYGVGQPSQKNMIDIISLIEDPDWLYEQYIIQDKPTGQISKDLQINNQTVLNYLKKAEISIKQHYWISAKCVNWICQLEQTEQITIIPEYPILGTRYRVDGYCVETNTIYEFHGDFWHGNPERYESSIINEVNRKTMGELYKRTLEREQQIKDLGYNTIIMWESTWDKQQKEFK